MALEMKRPRFSSILRIALLYMLWGGLWVVTTDYLVRQFVSDPQTVMLISIYKGWLFILVTALLLGVVLYFEMRNRLGVESEYEQLFDSGSDALFLLNEQGYIIKANREAVARYGYSLDELRSMTVRDLTPPDLHPVALTQFQKVFSQGVGLFEWRHRSRDGRVFDVEILSQRVVIRGKACLLSSAHDITQLKQTQRALQASLEDLRRAQPEIEAAAVRYRSLFQDSPNPLLEEDFSAVRSYLETLKARGVTDFEDYLGRHPEEVRECVKLVRILDVNAALVKMIHASDRQALLEGLEPVFDESSYEVFCQELVYIARGETLFDLLIPGRTLDGELRHTMIRWAAAPGSENSLERVYISVTDITERVEAEQALQRHLEHLEQIVTERTGELRRAQEQIMRQEKEALIGRLGGAMAHELRNPLGVISNAVYYLRLLNPTNAKIQEYLQIISLETKNATHTVADLLEYTRNRPPRLAARQARELLEGALHGQPAPQDVEVVLNCAEGLPPVWADVAQVERAIGKLLHNAYQAMPSGGRLSLEAVLHGEQVALWVRDNGVGIPAEMLEQVFEPLYTTRMRGIGLGLPIARKLVEANGGTLHAFSQAGMGCELCMLLPARQEIVAGG
jgi:PAS domain S-box-containing protein